MPLGEGWIDQYNRMLRTHDKLIRLAGPSEAGSDEVRDALYHFFEDAYALKDWVKNDTAIDAVDPTIRDTAERELFDPRSGVQCMQIAGDVCNGIKHLTLSPRYTPKTGDRNTTITNQNVTVSPLPVFVTTSVFGAGPTPAPPKNSVPATATHSWNVTSNGQTYDVLDLCTKVVAQWESWCKNKQLL